MEDNGGFFRQSFDGSANGGYSTSTPIVAPKEIAKLANPAASSLETTFTKTSESLSLESLSDEELEAGIEEDIAKKKKAEEDELLKRGERIRRKLVSFDSMIETLDDEEAPNFGKHFVERVKSANMGFDVAYEGLTSEAVYTAYSLAEANRGFPNKMRFHPNALQNIYNLFLYSTHERGHGIQNQDVRALKCSYFNPASLAVVHPLHWIELELHGERDTIAQTTFIASKMEGFLPGLRQHTIDENSILNVEEFEQIRTKWPSLKDAMVAASLQSLTKVKCKNTGLKYEDSYCDTALSHISAGLYWRGQFNLSKVTFVRLTENDFQEVGRHGILPNAMGEYFMEPLLRRQPHLNEANMARYQRLCGEYNIPDLYDCPTLSEYLDQEARIAMPNNSSCYRQMAIGGEEARTFQFA